MTQSQWDPWTRAVDLSMEHLVLLVYLFEMAGESKHVHWRVPVKSGKLPIEV